MRRRDPESIGPRLLALLVEHRQSGRELARAVGSTSGTISRITNGNAKCCQWSLVLAIADHFGVSVDDLIAPHSVTGGKSLYRELCERAGVA